MTSEHNEQLELLDNLIVNILFCAAPKSTIVLNRNKKILKNAFYNIFGLYIKNTNQYVVFLKIFDISKKKYTNNQYISMKYNDTYIFNTKEEVFAYLTNFLLDTKEHQRFLNEEIINNSNDLSGAEAVFIMNKWQKIITDHFNSKHLGSK
jgi:hypothetical protein